MLMTVVINLVLVPFLFPCCCHSRLVVEGYLRIEAGMSENGTMWRTLTGSHLGTDTRHHPQFGRPLC